MRGPICVLFAAVLWLPAALGAETLGVGDRIEPVVLENQHGEEHRLGPEIVVLLFTRDMDAGDLLKEALSDATARTLADRRAVYVSDIHRMPGLVATMFALPSMRRRPYPMLLDREGSVTRDYPSAPGQVTLIRLDGLEIRSVEFLARSEDVRSALGLDPPESD